MKIVTISELYNMVGKECTAIGVCGMAKDKEVQGVLLNDFIENEPVLKDIKGRLISVNRNTLELVK